MTAVFAPHSTDRPIAVEGDKYVLRGLVTHSGSYATGGDALDFGPNLNLGPGVVERVDVDPRSGYTFEYDYTNKKLKVFQGDNPNAAQAPGSELPAAGYPAALTSAPTRVRVVSK